MSRGVGLRAVHVAAAKRGAPYQWGAVGPHRFDCSGLTMWVYARLGKRLPRTAAQQYAATRHIPASARRPGDLVFFKTRSGFVHHVGIYAGAGQLWHAPGDRRPRAACPHLGQGLVRPRAVRCPAPASGRWDPRSTDCGDDDPVASGAAAGPTRRPVVRLAPRTAVMVAWLFLALAIATEVVGTLQLRELADGFRWLPALMVTVSYVASFALMVPALRTINVGVSYAIWSAVGTAAVAGLGVLIFDERLNTMGVIGIILIVGGVVVLTASGSTTHG